MVGAALVVNPREYVFKPMSAYSALMSCTYGPPGNPNGCSNCCDLCCAGWTEFCCTTHPETGNACPPGTIPAGWWRADGSGMCDVNGQARPRYYVDCNAECTDPHTGCGDIVGSGICGTSCTPGFDTCECAHGNCSNRKTSCTAFRYGQCNQDVAYVGVVVCRVVTCTPPYVWDPACTSFDPGPNQSTRDHDRACLHDGEPFQAHPARFHAGAFALGRIPGVGGPTGSFDLGVAADQPVFGDWNGNRVRTAGVVRSATAGRIGDTRVVWSLSNENSSGGPDIVVEFGEPGDIPVVGDWDGDGVDGIGVFRAGRWILRNQLVDSPTVPDIEIDFGLPNDRPVVGDWNGDGRTTVGVFRQGQWILYRPYGPRDDPAEELETFSFGDASGIPVVGDWDADGADGPGIVVGTQWIVRPRWWESATTSFTYGNAGDVPVVWAEQVAR